MDKRRMYLSPCTVVVSMNMQTVIAQSPQLENPEEGGNINPWNIGPVSPDSIDMVL